MATSIQDQVNAIHARLDHLTRDGHTMTAEELAEFDALESALVSRIDSIKPKTTGRKSQHDLSYFQGLANDKLKPTSGKRDFASVFRTNETLSGGGFDSAFDFFRAVNHRDHQRLAISQSEQVDSRGGFAVPQQFVADLITQALEESIVLSRAQVVPMTGDTLATAVFDDSDHSGGETFGGLYGSWTVEQGVIATKAVELYRIQLNAHKLAMLTKASNELLNDAPSFENQFLNRIRQSMGWSLDRAFLAGSGAGEPLGVLNCYSTITVAKETGQGAGTFSWENAIKMFARLYPPCLTNAVWVFSSTLIPQLQVMTVPVGTAGAVVQVFNERNGTYSLLGRPVVFSEKMSAAGTLGDALLCDFSKYIVGLNRDIRVDRSEHVAFTTDETTWRTTMRADGMGTWKSAFTPLHGDTQSWAVTLAARP